VNGGRRVGDQHLFDQGPIGVNGQIGSERTADRCRRGCARWVILGGHGCGVSFVSSKLFEGTYARRPFTPGIGRHPRDHLIIGGRFSGHRAVSPRLRCCVARVDAYAGLMNCPPPEVTGDDLAPMRARRCKWRHIRTHGHVWIQLPSCPSLSTASHAGTTL